MKVELLGIDELTNALRDAVEDNARRTIVKYHTAKLQKKAEKKVPVKTGHLKRSIKSSIADEGMTGIVRADADYSGYVEVGTRFMDAQPFMGPALNEVTEGFLNDMARIEGAGK